MRDRSHPLELLRQAADGRSRAGVRRGLVPRTAGHDGLVDLASNDYLGLCGDQRLAAAAVEATWQWGTGSTGSRLVTGTTALHARLEARLAEFAGAAAALVFSSGYLANLTVLTALAAALDDASGGGVLIVADAGNHASLIDACRLARGGRQGRGDRAGGGDRGSRGARVVVAAHRDPDAVRRALAGRDEAAAIVVSDAVFSVDGVQAPVAELHAVARDYGALLVLDEAHSFGVMGLGGRGAAAGIAAEPDLIRTVTLSKALAGQGGAVLAAPEVIGTLVDTGRGFIFDTGLAPPCAGAALAALEVVAAEPELGARARAAATRLAGIAAGLGLSVRPPDAAVLAVVVGDAARAAEAQRICAGHGVRAGCFRPPSVPEGQACLRLAARASLTESDFAAAVRALAAVRDHGDN
jgi:8-amino-7-oxononanoate synthase